MPGGAADRIPLDPPELARVGRGRGCAEARGMHRCRRGGAAGTAQYHINADIMYALRKYVEVSGDVDFLHRFGAEMLVETARFWLSLGNFVARDGDRFCING
jgi:trehalose/maltose hydrolase-like predicted phosphorylase